MSSGDCPKPGVEEVGWFVGVNNGTLSKFSRVLPFFYTTVKNDFLRVSFYEFIGSFDEFVPGKLR